MDVTNSLTEGRIDNYLKERMLVALENNESTVNTGKMEYCEQFKGILDAWKDYPISKWLQRPVEASLTMR